ncbi:MAG: N-formylglutamate amidohydrolase, partial [Pseudomonadota bacterium]|nr:N-formylglutamate amidohydrolase [Pseudomonadota bacterium]
MSLLNLNDPAAFSQYRLEKNSGLLFTSDHNGDAIPQELGCLGVPKHELRRHVAYDIGINTVAHYLSNRFDAPLIVANYSRLVIDC